MFLLLLVAAVIYFILGEPRDGAIMLIFVIGIISIDVMEEFKTGQTLNAQGTYLTLLAGDANNAPIARSMGLMIIMIANLFLVHINSSTHDFALHSFSKLIRDKVMWAVNLGTLLGILVILYTPLNDFLKLAPLSIGQFFGVIGIAAVSVLWYEVIKLINKFI